jgi:exopolysaccharide biosynthesis polyprenyl glycosylphosphotransferase
VAIQRQIEIPVRGRTRRVTRRLSLRPFVGAIDAVALSGAVVVAGGFDAVGVAYVLVALALLSLGAVRANRIDPRLSEDAGWLLGRTGIAVCVVLPFVGSSAAASEVLLLAPVAALFVAVGRGLAYLAVRAAKRRHLVGERTLIVGGGEVGADLASILRDHPEYGLRPVGFIGSLPEAGLPMPLLGAPEDLAEVVDRFEVQRVIVAFGEAGEGSLVSVLRACQPLGVRLHFVPRFFELGGLPEGAVADDLWGIPVVPLAHPALRRQARVLKRAFDILAGTSLLVLASPLLIAGAIAVRFSSPGPVLFRQFRVGRNGREFQILKFRTMFVNDAGDTAWFTSEDDRITPAGRVLRRVSIDELPQLFNVIRGDMSLVGPRPERPHYVGQFKETVNGYMDRHRVDPGITGWAQIHGRSRDLESIPERARFDNYYIEHWSLWRDVVIIARTVKTVLGAKG